MSKVVWCLTKFIWIDKIYKINNDKTLNLHSFLNRNKYLNQKYKLLSKFPATVILPFYGLPKR